MGYGVESVRSWVRQTDIDDGEAPGVATGQSEREKALEQEVRELRWANEIPQTGCDFLRGGARPPVTEVVALIEANKYQIVEGQRLGIEAICAVLLEAGMQVAASTYYAARNRPPSVRAVRARELIPQLQQIHATNYGDYGTRKLWKAAQRAGLGIGRDQTARLMKPGGRRMIGSPDQPT